MKRPITIRRSLLANLIGMIVLLGAGIMATTFIGTRRAAESLSGRMLEQSCTLVASRLAAYFSPVAEQILVVRGEAVRDVLRLDDPEPVIAAFLDVVERSPAISAGMLADDSGREVMVMRTEAGWRVRETDPARWERRVRWIEWEGDARDRATERFEESEYDPRTRPWFQGALGRVETVGGFDEPARLLHWTRPYIFFTSRRPGLTAAVALESNGGSRRVIGFDVLLEDVSDFTDSLDVSEQGFALVLSDDVRMVGLPRHPALADAATRRAALLAHPDDLGLEEVGAALAASRKRPTTALFEPFRFISAGKGWWCAVQRFVVGIDRPFLIAVMVPEEDLVGNVTRIRAAVLGTTMLVILIAVLRSILLARRYGRPLEALAAESDRIATGDLEAASPVATDVAEMRRLADAHDHMREGLRTLLRLERDIGVARDIQQRAFPKAMPQLPGWEFAAWNQPADETGGDGYDVFVVPGGALLFLADATGHGIGPALLATQLRSLVRMAARAGLPLDRLVTQVNAQLVEDLPTGRFVTAWFGRLHAETGRLESFSAGQAPMIVLRAEADAIERLDADVPPLGLVAALEVTPEPPIDLAPGDRFVVVSDGFTEARGLDGTLFGIGRVEAILRAGRDDKAAALIERLRRAIAEWTGDAPADDDRTIVVIRRLPG